MRPLAFLAALALAHPAIAATPSSWAIVCTAPCVASDGTTQPTGTALQKIWWDGVSKWTPPANAQAVPDAGQAIYTPATPTPTTIPALDFIRRFTPAEQSALQTANPLWGLQIAAAGTITVTDPTLVADMQTAVSGGVLTQARMAQILNLAVASP